MTIDKLFKTLSDPNRVQIIQHLANGECCSCQMQDKFKVSQPTLSYHLKMISDSGLAQVKKVGTWNKYILNQKRIDEMIDFLLDLKQTEVCKCK